MVYELMSRIEKGYKDGEKPIETAQALCKDYGMDKMDAMGMVTSFMFFKVVDKKLNGVI